MARKIQEFFKAMKHFGDSVTKSQKICPGADPKI
jgi:hypothetical protein